MERIPVIILGGSDLRPGRAEGPTEGLHPLAAYKGAHLLFDGRPLAACLAERFERAGGFGPIRIAGPARIYSDATPELEVVDTDGALGANLRAGLDHHMQATPGPLALVACDVLPTAEELAELRTAYDRDAPLSFWFPLVRKPEDHRELGAFAWKPSYRLVPAPGGPPVEVLPGHLAIFDPAALRLPLVHGLLAAAYRERNRSIRAKRAAMVRTILAGLLRTDLRLALSLRAPTRTFETLATGTRIARRLHGGQLSVVELERGLERILVRRSHMRSPEVARFHLPLVDYLSLAEDIDTEEEAAAQARVELVAEGPAQRTGGSSGTGPSAPGP